MCDKRKLRSEKRFIYPIYVQDAVAGFAVRVLVVGAAHRASVKEALDLSGSKVAGDVAVQSALGDERRSAGCQSRSGTGAGDRSIASARRGGSKVYTR